VDRRHFIDDGLGFFEDEASRRIGPLPGFPPVMCGSSRRRRGTFSNADEGQDAAARNEFLCGKSEPRVLMPLFRWPSDQAV